jgi:TPR repeat protein
MSRFCWSLLSGILFALFVGSATAGVLPRGASNQGESLRSLGLDVTLARRAFIAGLDAFEEEEFALARRYWEPVALHGHVRSQYYMGLLNDSHGFQADPVQAAIWFRMAAQQGLPEAQHKLALAYARGDGVVQNLPRATRWWLRAAQQGNTESQYNLGVIYTLGENGITRDTHKAAYWWRQAALSGDPMAQYNLGTLYASGDAGRTDLCQALHWWQRSRQNGFEQAEVALRSIQGQRAIRQCRTQASR